MQRIKIQSEKRNIFLGLNFSRVAEKWKGHKTDLEENSMSHKEARHPSPRKEKIP